MKKRITKILVGALLLVTLFPGQGVQAAYMSDRQAGMNGYSLVGINVFNFTLHASGYSYTNSGSVTAKWTTSWSIFPNNIQNETTWTEAFPRGMYAYGSFKNVIGVPSPWGAVGIGHNTQYLKITF